MIKARNIYKKFGTVEVLKGIDLEIAKGEVVSIVGKSGAGKSTLLHILGTLEDMDKGEVFINDKDISKFSSNEIADFRNKELGFVFQFHHLLPEFTAIENVCLPGWMQNTNKKEVEKEAKKLLSFLGLGHRIEHKPSELSGGEQQRVAIARALINKPSVVFADEPTGNLDSNTSNELHQLFFNLRDEFGHTFVIVTHNNELAQQSDRQISMLDGNLI